MKLPDTGKVRVSGPELTAYDLFYYMERLGGLVRCIAVLEELAENLDPQIFASLVQENPVLAPWQRLGYTLEHLLDKTEAADAIFRQIKKQRIYRILLNPAGAKSGFSAHNRWNIIENHSMGGES